MSGFQGYDQWKTASPYDDDIDPIDEAERFLKETIDNKDPLILYARSVIEELLLNI